MLTSFEARAGAVHEAAHSIVAGRYFHYPVTSIRLFEKDGEIKGNCSIRYPAPLNHRARCLIALSGPIGEARFRQLDIYGDHDIPGARTDFAMAREFAALLSPATRIEDLRPVVSRLIDFHWPQIERLADRLLLSPVLGAAQLYHLLG